MTNMGERIAYARELQNMKQKDLAEAIGVTKATMSKYENNINIPNGEILAKIATVLDTSADYLLGLTGRYIPSSGAVNTDLSIKKLSELFSKLNKENKIRVLERVLTLLENQQ